MSGLVTRLLSHHEKGGNRGEFHLLHSSIIRLSENRIQLVLTELEKILSRKSCEFQRIRASENTQEQLFFAEELLLLMDLIYSSLTTYCHTIGASGGTSTSSSTNPIEIPLPLPSSGLSNHSSSNENYQILNKNLCNLLMSTIGGVIFFQSQFLEIERISFRLNYSCGQIISILSEMNQEGANFHVNQILKQCLESQAEQRGNFFTLKSIQYLKLRTDGMMLLCSHIADVIDLPTNSGKWKKNAMLEITTPLRLCLFQWLDTDSSAIRMIYTSALDCPDHPSILALLYKLEPWASGAKKRSSVWPLIMILLALMPKSFQIALEQLRATSPLPTARLTLEAKLLKRTLETLKPSTMQNILQKDSALFTELSLISLISMMKVAAVLKRYLLFGTTGNIQNYSSILTHQFNSNQFTSSQRCLSLNLSRNPSVAINQNMETSFANLWSFISPCIDKLVVMVFQGIYPTSLYYNAIAISPTSVFVPQSSLENHSNDSSQQTVVQEFTPESLFDLFMWSLYYIDQVKYFQLMIKIYSSYDQSVPNSSSANSSHSFVNPFVRTQSICALSKILMSDYIDRIGKTPTWRLTLAAEVLS